MTTTWKIAIAVMLLPFAYFAFWFCFGVARGLKRRHRYHRDRMRSPRPGEVWDTGGVLVAVLEILPDVGVTLGWEGQRVIFYTWNDFELARTSGSWYRISTPAQESGVGMPRGL